MSSRQASSTARRVLLVDDDAAVADALARLLRLDGYEVWSAASAGEGLRLARLHLPHAVIVDLRVPLTSGLQVLRDLRAIPALTATPVGLVTAEVHAANGRAAEVDALGAVLRFKPVWVHELVSLARELVTPPPQN